jgi:hypothetical protein
VQSHEHATQQGYATQSEAEPETPNPPSGRETGLNNLSRGPGETAHRSITIYVLRDVLESKMQNGRQDRSPVSHDHDVEEKYTLPLGRGRGWREWERCR